MRRDYDELRVDHTSEVPLSVQLALNLSRAIRAGWWQADEALPSERMLSNWLKLSRVTTRRAYDWLVQEGLIYRRRGAGSFVKQMYEYPLGHLQGFTELFRARGLNPRSKWLSKKLDHPTTEEALALNINMDDWVVRFRRQRLVERKAIAYEVTTLPAWAVGDVTRLTDSIYAFLDQSGHGVMRAHQHIMAMNATAQVAKYCGIPTGQAMLQVTRIGYTESGQVLEYTVTYCRNDYYDFTLDLHRKPQGHSLSSKLDVSKQLIQDIQDVPSVKHEQHGKGVGDEKIVG